MDLVIVESNGQMKRENMKIGCGYQNVELLKDHFAKLYH